MQMFNLNGVSADVDVKNEVLNGVTMWISQFAEAIYRNHDEQVFINLQLNKS